MRGGVPVSCGRFQASEPMFGNTCSSLLPFFRRQIVFHDMNKSVLKMFVGQYNCFSTDFHALPVITPVTRPRHFHYQ